ncbi:MAG TPA: PQQ-binding-like beta-propeller repeat protein [Pyrinomonadaceae bacterium]|nr:PQQ-binding-like beta-propeller repeat protein [Pyrinomonadaceae bacterium]
MLARASKYLLIITVSLVAFGPLGASAAGEDDLVLSNPLVLKWRYASDQTSNFTPATDTATVYVPLADGTLVALDSRDGQLRWKSEPGGDFSAAPAVDEHAVYVATQYATADKAATRGMLRALSKETGITLWMRTLSAPLRGSLAVDGSAVFAGAANGGAYAFEKSNGRTVWVNQYSDEFDGQPALTGDRVYLGTLGGWLLALNRSNGDVIWRYRTRGAIRGPIAVADGIVVFGSADGSVYACRDRRGEHLWKHRTGAAVGAVVAIDGGVLASSLDNYAYLLSLKKGALLWRQLLPGRIPARPVTAPDGALFTPLSTDTAIVLSLKNGKPLNTLQLSEENNSSAAPIVTSDRVVLTTPHAVMAFAPNR